MLGAGLSGMAAAKSLGGVDCRVFEARSHSGGHASSFQVDGYTFDEGPHVSFTPNERIKNFLARSVNHQFFEYPTYATNYFKGHILRHPVQTNLRGLPPQLISACIADFVRAQYEDKRELKNYGDWCYRGLGKTISETFTRPYTRKYWNLEMEQLTTEWVSERVYAPKLEEVIDGALAEAEGQHYYMAGFRYPEYGGFGGYNRLLTEGTPIEYGMRATEIDLAAKKMSFEDGTTVHFEHLISSVPLPEIIRLCKDVPQYVRDAAAELACSSHFIVSIGINRPHISDAFWTYYYDEDIPFSRTSFPSKYSHRTAKEGTSSLQAEVVHSRYKALPSKEGLVEQCIDSLLKVGLLHSRDEIVALDARDLRYANVIFDFKRTPNMKIVHEFLRKSGVPWCGRYGEWAYLWTDQSILSGERAANEVRAKLGLASRGFDEGI